MLSQKNRIKKSNDFSLLFKRTQGAAHSYKNDLFILKVKKNNLGLDRFGFVVSQKVSKKATIRNKVKRRLSEAVRAHLSSTKNGTDAVLIALPVIEKASFREIKQAVVQEFRRAGLAIKKSDV